MKFLISQNEWDWGVVWYVGLDQYYCMYIYIYSVEKKEYSFKLVITNFKWDMYMYTYIFTNITKKTKTTSHVVTCCNRSNMGCPKAILGLENLIPNYIKSLCIVYSLFHIVLLYF